MATPEGWRDCTLADVAADVPHAISDGPFGSALKLSDYVSSGIPVLQGKNITGDRFIWSDVRFISHPKAEELRRSQVREGDVLLVKIGTIGYSAILDNLQGYAFGVIPANLAKVTLDSSIASTEFVRQALVSDDTKRALQRSASRTAQPALSLATIRSLPLRLPPLGEQHKIAAILSSIDDTIEKTEAVIAQLEVVKKAMMQELLTRGMPGRHTRFTQTDIGEIPEGWSIGTLASTSTRGPQNGLYKPAEFYGDGTPMLDMGELFRSHTVENCERRRLRLSSIERERFLLSAGDLVFARRSLVPEGAGQCALVPELEEYPVFESSIIRFSPDSLRCSPSFLAHFWNGPPGQALRMKIVRVVAVSGVTGADLAALPMPLPSLVEQCEIADVLDEIDLRVRSETEALESTIRVKRALASVLLSGDLRVTPAEALP